MKVKPVFLLTIIASCLYGQFEMATAESFDARKVSNRWVEGLNSSITEPGNRVFLIGSVIGTGLAFGIDSKVHSFFKSNRIMPDDLAELGRTAGYFPAPMIVYASVLVPAVLHSETPGNLYSDLEMITGAYVMNTAVVYSLKFLTGRTRPDGSNTRSFPSGHSANGFLMASLIHQMHGLKTGLPFYGLAAVIAASRLQHEKHYLSDVIMGAGIGFVVGRGFAKVYDRKTDAISVIPVIQTRNNRMFTGLSLRLAI